MRITKEEIPIYGNAYSLLKIAFIAINEKLVIEYVNDYAKKTLKLSKSQSIIGFPLVQILEDLKFPQLIDNNANLIQKKPILIENSFRKWECISTSIESENWYFLVDQDVTEKEEIYRALEDESKKITGQLFSHRLSVTQYINEIHNYLTSIINKIPCYVYWKNRSLQYIGCNEMAAKFFNFKSTEEIVGKTDFDLFSDHNLIIDYQESDREVFAGEPLLNLPLELMNNCGEIFQTLVSKVPIINKTGEIIGIIGITVDITKEKQAEMAKTAFIANMSHDIRTPLSGIVGISKLIQDAVKTEEEKKFAHWVNESGIQLLNLLNSILDVVSLENVSETNLLEETFDLRQLINDLIKLEYPSVAMKNLDFFFEIDKQVPASIITDHNKLHRSLLNLVGNAIKFTEKGYVKIKVKFLEQKNDFVKLKFCVEDTGIGIPKEAQSKVFERFFRATPSSKGVYAGHGVGLHIAQTYVQLLGGEIKLTSQEGAGTTFYFDLSLKVGNDKDIVHPIILTTSNKSAHEHTPPPLPITHVSAGIERAPHLLLVEDNVIALKMIETYAVKAGCRFSSAINGELALELFKAHHFDLIITDIGLPGMSGTELVHMIRESEVLQHQKPVPIVGLTAHSKGQRTNEFLQSGMNDIFTKPISLSTLQAIVSRFTSIVDNKQKMNDQENEVKTEEKLGNDLPELENQLFELNKFPLLDINSAVESIGKEEMLHEILSLMVNQEIPRDLSDIQKAYADKDWDGIEKIAHKMKGGTVYCGTIRMKFACQYLERYRKAGHASLLEKLYHQLLQVVQETKQGIEQWLQK